MSLRTPLKEVRRLGSAKEGTSHFWTQRLTAVANIVLTMFLLLILLGLAGADHATVKGALSRPWIAIPVLLLLVSAAVHMRIGMQVIIEDYIHSEGLKIVLLIANSFFAMLVAALSAFSILKLAFGG
jgi:succinate dehydrogenase / fumarate reductase membrane anchor subunit